VAAAGRGWERLAGGRGRGAEPWEEWGPGATIFFKKIAFPQFGNIATEEKHQITLESDDIMLHIYLYLSFL
jgi:hypothetical protein